MEDRFVLTELGHYCKEDMADYWGKPGSREQLLFSFPFFIQMRIPAHWICLPNSREVFGPWLNLSGNYITDILKLCLLGDPKSRHIDNEDCIHYFSVTEIQCHYQSDL